MNTVTALVGAQFGSEGKGVVARYFADQFNVHVRTGGPNAGHSFVFRGKQHKMQALPCGWINPAAILIIGANAVVNIEILLQEVLAAEEVMGAGTVRSRLLIDHRAGILEPAHHLEEGGVGGKMHHDIGSTGEGVGTCRRDRLMRDKTKFRQMEALDQSHPLRANVIDTVNFLHTNPGDCLLEGTQGFGLSLIHGPWPKCTSADTTAAQLVADAGLAPRSLSKVIMVARTMPIRVAGNSGPLKGETSWEELSSRLGRPVEERTTVTKKIRRIGEWDDDLVAQAARVNGADEIVLTFMDYLNPKDHGIQNYDDLSDEAKQFMARVMRVTNTPVTLVGTGYSDTEGWSVCDVRKGT